MDSVNPLLTPPRVLAVAAVASEEEVGMAVEVDQDHTATATAAWEVVVLHLMALASTTLDQVAEEDTEEEAEDIPTSNPQEIVEWAAEAGVIANPSVPEEKTAIETGTEMGTLVGIVIETGTARGIDTETREVEEVGTAMEGTITHPVEVAGRDTTMIWVNTEEENQEVGMKIRDNGDGIELLFSSFLSLLNSGSGTGLSCSTLFVPAFLPSVRFELLQVQYEGCNRERLVVYLLSLV